MTVLLRPLQQRCVITQPGLIPISHTQKHERLRGVCYKQCFKDVHKIHPQFPSGNVSSLLPLSLAQPQYVLLLVPGKQDERRIALGEGMTYIRL